MPYNSLQDVYQRNAAINSPAASLTDIYGAGSPIDANSSINALYNGASPTAGGYSTGPIWGSPEWNATNDPQHARDIAWFQSPEYQRWVDAQNQSEIATSHNPNTTRNGILAVGSIIGGAGLGSLFDAGGGVAGIGEGSAGTAATGVTPAATQGVVGGIGGGDTGLMAGLGGAGGGTTIPAVAAPGAAGAAPSLAQVGTATGLAGTAANALGDSPASPPLSATQDPLGSGGDPGNTTAGGGSGGAGAGTALSRILDGSATTADWTSVLGNAAGTGLGIAGSINQQHALEDLANRQMAMGAPYRDRLAALYNDPGSYLRSPEVTGAVQQGTDALARSLSVQGNPIGSGHALQELQNYSTNQQLNRLGDERSRLGALGGLASFNAAAPGTSLAGVNAGSNVYNALGSGIANLTNPQPSLVDLYRSMRGLA